MTNPLIATSHGVEFVEADDALSPITAELVETAWSFWENYDEFYEGDVTRTPDGELSRSAFDRWLAAHDRKIAAEVWDEGWDTCMEYVDGPDWGQAPPNPYRADRVEQGGES